MQRMRWNMIRMIILDFYGWEDFVMSMIFDVLEDVFICCRFVRLGKMRRWWDYGMGNGCVYDSFRMIGLED